MDLTVTADFADRLREFRQSGEFSLGNPDTAYSPYWQHYRDLITFVPSPAAVDSMRTVRLGGEEGFYVPLEASSFADQTAPVRRRLRLLKQVVLETTTRKGMRSPIYLEFDDAYGPAQERLLQMRGASAAELGWPVDLTTTRRDFAAWSGRRARGHIFVAYHLLSLCSLYRALPAGDGLYLEVGAGSGNLPSLVMHYFPHKRVVIVDLPETLLLSASYLASLFPDRRFALPHEAARQGIDEADCVFLTPDQLDLIPDSGVDFASNVHSFQEMTQAQIRVYFELFSRVVAPGGQLLVVNRDEKVPVEGDLLGDVPPPNRFDDYPWPEDWEVRYSEQAHLHSLVLPNAVMIRLLRRGA